MAGFTELYGYWPLCALVGTPNSDYLREKALSGNPVLFNGRCLAFTLSGAASAFHALTRAT